ncbi:CGNR zinc finger domain-containing protein [Metabacillus bambusae]|uniref:CGNR zinc finger domain-containing protein n=1 Tax=Metabacillus bambusae TaxID=2795218 RepID=A0ABS3N6S3_9BACI|nr:CGNR zinc finger domain-containing protein [Metabacillus bambusae]MBO1513593.1 CGNR zinc finger domain-containing protein [Metabacillus bambusae]
MVHTNNFPLITGNTSLDLVNTEVVRRGQRINLLLSKEDVLAWMQVMRKDNASFSEQLIDQAEDRIEKVYPKLLEFRTFLREHFERIADGEPIPHSLIDILEKRIELAPFIYKVVNDKLVPFPMGNSEDAIISLIAFDCLILMESKKLNGLKRCINPDCVLLFIDEGGRRKWCSMKICGNRKKAARFKQRKVESD